jgi:hypothetical protein
MLHSSHKYFRVQPPHSKTFGRQRSTLSVFKLLSQLIFLVTFDYSSYSFFLIFKYFIMICFSTKKWKHNLYFYIIKTNILNIINDQTQFKKSTTTTI